jgi:DNA repair exonuclease SbcCD ATPase subunit
MQYKGDSMSEELKDGVAEQPIEQENSNVETQNGLTLDEVNKMIAEAVGETTKKWQSRFDQVVAEKKQTEGKAKTVEEQIAELRAERERERIDWARKEAKARASIDDDLHSAILSYASNDVETVNSAADSIRRFISEKYEAKIQDLEKRLQFGSKPPVGNGKEPPPTKTMTAAELAELPGAQQQAFFRDGGQLVNGE